MTTIDQTPYGRLETEGRLFNAVLKAPTADGDRFAYRGDFALKFQDKVADEARPPDFCMEQILTLSNKGDEQIPVMAGYLHNFEYLQSVVDVLGDLLGPDGKYFMFCNNVDLSKTFSVTMDGKSFYVFPCDESSVWKEMLELLRIDKNDVKKMSTVDKTEYVLNAALEFDDKFEEISFERGVEEMEPVKNRNENRPV